MLLALASRARLPVGDAAWGEEPGACTRLRLGPPTHVIPFELPSDFRPTPGVWGDPVMGVLCCIGRVNTWPSQVESYSLFNRSVWRPVPHPTPTPTEMSGVGFYWIGIFPAGKSLPRLSDSMGISHITRGRPILALHRPLRRDPQEVSLLLLRVPSMLWSHRVLAPCV